MALTDATKNAMLDLLSTRAAFLSLHTADPGSTGMSEATGGSPAYARKSATWSSASGGSKALSSAVTFDVPAGTYTHVGYWSAGSGGTYSGSRALTASTTFGGQAQLTISAVTESLT
ncbi:hypothetical protein ABT336_13345 [Micromonospora sp. NPDC000207]|uniref:phage tail fiber protein n=1 Tax=Micromonospora sp. NPDC000207 TaxID=3154246 RepID=UPI0033346F89